MDVGSGDLGAEKVEGGKRWECIDAGGKGSEEFYGPQAVRV